MMGLRTLFSRLLGRATHVAVWALVAGVFVSVGSGCRTSSPESEATSGEEAEAPRRVQDLPGMRLPPAQTPDETPLRISELAPASGPEATRQPVFPERRPAKQEKSAPPSVPYPDQLIKSIPEPDSKVNVTLNLDATPLQEVVELFAALLDFDYLIDPGVKGTVSMTVDAEMPAREAWQLFEHILWLAGAYASPNPGFIHILPFNKMPQERRIFAKHEPMANVEVAVETIYNTKSSEILKLINPFLTDGATATDIPRMNSILLVEAPANMPKIRELIRRLDANRQAEWPQVCIRCRNVDAETVVDELKQILPVLGFPVTDKAESGGEIKLAALPRLQVIVASAPLPDVLDEVERWVRALDREDATEQESLFFYNVRHSTASHLMEALSTFFNTTGAATSQPSRTKSTSAKGAPTTGRTTPTTARRVSTSSTRKRTGTEQTGRPSSVFDIPIVVYADDVQNRLTIRTTGRAWTMVQALVQRLDIPPRQVMIQATIAEITLNKSTEFGFTYAARRMLSNGAFPELKAAVVNTTVLDQNRLVDSIDTGAAILFKRTDDELAFVRAVAGETNVRVLSAPQVLATSDEEATINVGNRVPVITGDYTSVSATATTTGSTYRNIQYQDTGIILTVTPHITAGNEIKLDVKQEVSDAVKTETSGIDSPTIQTRLLETSLVLPDGGTALLGGLIRTRTDKSADGVPWLMHLPVIGGVFRTNSRVNNRTELIILMSAKIVESETDVEQLARRYRAALEEIRDKLNQ